MLLRRFLPAGVEMPHYRYSAFKTQHRKIKKKAMGRRGSAVAERIAGLLSGARAKIVHVEIEKDHTGVFFATSPDLKGLFVSESDPEILVREIPINIRMLYAAQGIDVEVLPAHEAADEEATPWVAVFPQPLATPNHAA